MSRISEAFKGIQTDSVVSWAKQMDKLYVSIYWNGNTNTWFFVGDDFSIKDDISLQCVAESEELRNELLEWAMTARRLI